ncbi:hypothetical protein MTP99_017073 [Tenebrio molitor]|nr:hypothetical protein MTP99_017073 [Tenebrio molitor]
MGSRTKPPSCSWGGSARATIFVIILPAATSAASLQAFYRFSRATNTTSMENLYNCTETSCELENDTLAHNATNDTLTDGSRGEPLADLILMGVLSVVLGLMILVTVIGRSSFIVLMVMASD